MKCPYCAEEVQEEAKVCRYCGRDLSLVLENKRMQEKIASLENQIPQLSASLDALPKETQAVDGESSSTQTVTDANDKSTASDSKRLQAALWLVILASVPFPALLGFLVLVFLTPSSQARELSSLVANIIGLVYLVVVPILGAGAELMWPSRYLRWYVLLGSLVFSTSFGLRFILDIIRRELAFNGNAILVPLLFIFGALFVKFWQRKGLAERVSTELKRGQILLALFLPTGVLLVIGSIIAWPKVLSMPLISASPVLVLSVKYVSVLMLLSPLPSGFWAGLRWPGRHPKGYILLGLAAGLPVSIILGLIEFMRGDTGIPNLMVLGNTLALWYVGGLTVLLFFAGGLFADVLKNKMNPNLVREPGFAQSLAIKVAAPDEEPSKNHVLLIQSLAPAIISFIGTMLSAITTSLVALKVAGIF